MRESGSGAEREDTPPPVTHGTMTSKAFWEQVDRLDIPDAEALALIGYPGKLPASGKRPRFRLNTLQTRLATYLGQIEAALLAGGKSPDWLRRRSRGAPFGGRTPLAVMGDAGGMATVLQALNIGLMRKALGAARQKG
jgi:hypothetical protein